MQDDRTEMSVADSLAAAELEKLRLEIEDLKNSSDWRNEISAFTPLISVIIAVGGFLFGIYQFQRQQQLQQERTIVEQRREQASKELDQKLRIQNQIRSDLEQLLQFVRDKQQTVSKAFFLLGDLKAYLSVANAQVQPGEAVFLNNGKGVTASLVNSVIHDCDFNQFRDVTFDLILYENWDDYKEYFVENPYDAFYIADKYVNAMNEFCKGDPDVLSKVEYNNGTFLYIGGFGRIGPTKVRHFEAIAHGFRVHIRRVKDEDQKDLIEAFERSIKNPKFTRDFLSISSDTQTR